MDLVPMGPEDLERAREQMKIANTRRIMDVLNALEPWVTGVMGPVAPNQVAVYLKAVRELGLLWDVYSPPKPVEVEQGADESPMVLEARQAQVVAELEKLRQVGMKRRPGS